jgi:hypothetical protein
MGETQQQVTQPHRSKTYPEEVRGTESAVIEASVPSNFRSEMDTDELEVHRRDICAQHAWQAQQ